MYSRRYLRCCRSAAIEGNGKESGVTCGARSPDRDPPATWMPGSMNGLELTKDISSYRNWRLSIEAHDVDGRQIRQHRRSLEQKRRPVR